MKITPFQFLFFVLTVFLSLSLLGGAKAISSERTTKVHASLPPEIDAFRKKLWAQESHGESYRMMLTEEMLKNTAFWFLAKHPKIPFSEPDVQIRPEGFSGSIVISGFSFSTKVTGNLAIRLEEGALKLYFGSMSVDDAKAPDLVVRAVQTGLQVVMDIYFNLSDMPTELQTVEYKERHLVIEGIYGQNSDQKNKS